MPELRTPVMIVVQASWKDAKGDLQIVPARMEDKSPGGACLRTKIPIPPGVKLRIQWRFEQFSGTVKYCRIQGREYRIGIQREASEEVVNPSLVEDLTPPVARHTSFPPLKISASKSSHDSALHQEAKKGYSIPASPPRIVREPRLTRRTMATTARRVNPKRSDHASFFAELLSIDDIYRIAGIALSREGNSVHKLVDMLKNEHIRGLSKETKRAAVLMAIAAAGISVEEVCQDAEARLNALNFYEAEQLKLAHAEWERRAEEITQIQAEQERANAHFSARINRNIDDLERDKARFSAWIAIKQHEAQSMSEALDLCLTPQLAGSPTRPTTEARATASTSTALQAEKH